MSAPRRVSLVAALSRNGIIGRDNAMPWHLPEDLKYFKRITLGHPVIMGRKTFESILATLGKPLPGRDNIVVTRSGGYSAPGCHAVHSIEAALEAAHGPEAFVIGGAQLYALALPFAHRLYLTEIDAEFDGDTLFPAFERSQWTETSRESHRSESGQRLPYAFVVYDRVAEPRADGAAPGRA